MPPRRSDLKAMKSLQELNPNKDTASNAQIMFMVLHASGLTIIPVSIIAQRAILKSNDPTSIFIPCMIVTFVATVVALTVVAIKQKINLFQPVILVMDRRYFSIDRGIGLFPACAQQLY